MMLLLLLQARPCARSRERYARRAAVVGKEQDGRVRSGRVLPLCVGKRKGKERERRGQRTQKAQKPKDTDWYSELLSRFGCATLHTVHTYTSHLIHTSHLTPHTHTSHSTLHTSHFTLHTSHFTPPLPPLPPQPTRRGPPAAQGQAPLIPGRLPGYSLVLSDLRGLRGGWYPLLLARACPGRTRTSPTSQVRSDPERGQDAHLPLACLVGQSRFDWYRACSQGFATPPCSSGSRNGTLLFLSVHTTVTGRLALTGAEKSLLLLSALSPTSSVNGV
jgi:hypothetical protein